MCYECPNSAHFGGDVDTILIRPQLYIPGATEVFQYLSRAAGWTAKISDKGFFSQDTVQKQGGLEQSAAMVRDPRSRAVLWRYLECKPKESAASQQEAVFLDSVRRWYLSFDGITSGFENEEQGKTFLDDLLSRQILHRGVILKCEYCRSADWFPVAEIDDGFKCSRCRRTQRIASKHTLGKREPGWYYQLDEIVFQGLKHNMHVPLLALDHQRKNAKTFLYSEELEIWKPGEDLPFKEIDICCICDGLLTIGEAKAASRIEAGGRKERATLHKYREVAEGLGARRLVLATSQSWAAETIENARRIFEGTRIEVVPLSGADLMS